MKIYVAGPMAGLPDHNYPKFFRVADELRAQGHIVFNPAEINSDFATVGREVCMRRDIEAVLVCEGVFFLKGWECSEGATCEWQVAKQIGLVRLYEPEAYVPLSEWVDAPDNEVNYVVVINGRNQFKCRTAEDAWDIIGRQRFGSGHMVSSPTGKDCSDFVPY